MTSPTRRIGHDAHNDVLFTHIDPKAARSAPDRYSALPVGRAQHVRWRCGRSWLVLSDGVELGVHGRDEVCPRHQPALLAAAPLLAQPARAPSLRRRRHLSDKHVDKLTPAHRQLRGVGLCGKVTEHEGGQGAVRRCGRGGRGAPSPLGRGGGGARGGVRGKGPCGW
eukprot:scaffold207893_cov24-Tisochrysis_lutea.AAC.1